MTSFSFESVYEGDHKQADWVGVNLPESDELRDYFASRVIDRLEDSQEAQSFEDELSDLASTGLAIGTIARIIGAPKVDTQPWEVGEAFAECVLEDTEGAVWPWNMNRDKRTPKASLPGADLIGFVIHSDGAWLAVGEVKTSSDPGTPPNVMFGRHGMIQQLERFTEDSGLQRSVLKWLAARCRNTEHWPSYQGSVKKFLESGGRAVFLFGVLLRDTTPSEEDLRSRGKHFGEIAVHPTDVRLRAWYAPWKCDEWYGICADHADE